MKIGARTPTTPALIPRVVCLLVGVLLFAAEARAQNAHHVVIEGSVKRGDEFARDLGRGFTFRLKGTEGWTIEITHTASGDQDLIYPVNPPYRFSNRQYIGPGYGESAQDSVKNTPREFAFLYRPDTFGTAWRDLDLVLWPYNYSESEVEQATSSPVHFPTGTLIVEILSADFASGDGGNGDPREEVVSGVTFRATISWPGP